MALARAHAVALLGISGHVVAVEAHLAPGLPGLTLVGLPDASLHEARDRVRAAVVNSGLSWPQQRLTVGLSPATLPKSGSSFDLAIAVAVLAAAGQVPQAAAEERVYLGELGLDGSARHVRGVLPAVLSGVEAGWSRIVVAREDGPEARLVPGANVEDVATLAELVAVLRGRRPPTRVAGVARAAPRLREPDLEDVMGQPLGRRAVEVSAAGGHHLYLQGPPGAGKSLLASRLPGLLPDLDPQRALEVTAVHSVAGLLPPGTALVTRPPFRNPHHTASGAALVGGGSGVLRPGEVSCAHGGCLFLDEAPEFARPVLDALREPLECGFVQIVRARARARFPARFLLLLAANPCACAAAGAPGCSCSPSARRRYLTRLSGPLLDRVDLQVDLPPVGRADLLADVGQAESSSRVRERVAEARAAAANRWSGTGWSSNAEIDGPELRRRWAPPRPARAALDRQLERGRLTARGYDRVLKIAWTLADLAGHPVPGAAEIGEALLLRVPGLTL